MTRAQFERIVLDRVCGVCRQRIPEDTGVYQADLGFLTHQGPCNTVLKTARKDFSRSSRGRWRRKGDVLRSLGLKDGHPRDTVFGMMAHAENARPMLADIARYAAARRHDDSIGFTTFVLGRMWPMLQSRS